MKRLAYILMAAAFVLTACSKDEFVHPSEADAPRSASDYTPVITVDQELNQVTFALGEKGVVPVWVFQNSAGEWVDYQARDGYKKIFAAAGDYSVRMYVMNASGLTPDYVEKTFHINNTIMSFDKYVRQISGGSEKVWRIDNSVDAHHACGESIANPSGWWAAKPDEKAAFGIYDNRLTFSAAGDYTFDPGASGTVYVNAGVTVAPYGEFQESSDYVVGVNAQTTPYQFGVEGSDLVLKLENGALFPYIPNNDYVTDSKFYVISIDNNSMTLVWYTATGNGGGPIAWQFILTSKAGAVSWNGFKYDAASNLWKAADADMAPTYFYAPGWAQIEDPALEHSGSKYTWTFPVATTDRWQAQVFLVPSSPISLTSSKNYDFSCILSSSNKLTAKVKVHRFDEGGSDADNGVVLVDADVPLNANEDVIFYVSDAAGIDAGNIRIVLDFGGNPDNTEVTISNIVLKDHSVDDGTVPPGDEPGDPGQSEEGAHFDITGPTNMWRSMTYTMGFYTSHGESWEGLPDSGFEADDANFVYNVSMPEATDKQWQRQVAFHTTMSSSADKKYDFCCTVTPTMDLPGVTIKLVLDGGGENDNIFYFADRHDMKAYEPFVYKMANMDGIDMDRIALFFDFGGNPAGAEAEIKDICFQEHQDPQGGSGGGSLSYDSADNLWKPVDAEGGHTYSQYYATTSGWTRLEDPEITQKGNAYSFTLGTETVQQWQAQFFIIPTDATRISLSAEKKYDFQCTVELSQDVPQVTFKLTDTTDDGNFLFTERRDITAYETFVFSLADVAGIDAAAVKMVFDFGGNPADTEVLIKDIILQEHK